MARRMHPRQSLTISAALAFGLLIAVGAPAAPMPDAEWDAEADTGDLDSDTATEWEDETGLTDADWQTGSAVPRGTASGAFTHSFTFDGTSSDSTTLENGASFEDLPFSSPELNDAGFEMWFKPTDLSGKEILWESGGGVGLSFLLDGDQVQFAVDSGGGQAAKRALLSATLSGSSDFVQVIGSLDLPEPPPGSGSLELFVNGASRDSGAIDFTDDGWTGSNSATLAPDFDSTDIGGTNDLADESEFGVFDGEIALFNFYHDQTIDSTEAEQLYNRVIPEPASLALLAPTGLLLLRRRRAA